MFKGPLCTVLSSLPLHITSMMEGLVFMEAEHVFFFIFPWRNFLRWDRSRGWWVHGISADLVRMKTLPVGQMAETSPSYVFPVFSLQCGVVLWCSLHSWQMSFSIMFLTLRICTLAKALSMPCSHGMIACKPVTIMWKSVWGWQGSHSPLGSHEGGDRLLPRSSVAGMEQGRVSALPQVILLAHAGSILAKLDKSLPWCEVPIASFFGLSVCNCS